MRSPPLLQPVNQPSYVRRRREKYPLVDALHGTDIDGMPNGIENRF
tara:strand:+ start:25816 stop:25953 length:138 start_codon:yes stop_codon:yes gene_type:complete